MRLLTFEVVADEAVTVGGILNDASRDAILCEDTTPIGGYAAMGSSMGAAIDPLVTGFGVDLTDDGDVLRSPVVSVPIAIEDDDLGCSVDHKEVARTEREQVPARSLPDSVLLTYYDPERDFQTGQSRSDLIDRLATEEKIELPAVVTAGEARTLAERLLAQRWAQRDKLTLRLPPSFMTMLPGTTVGVPGSSNAWLVTRSTIDQMVSVVDLRPLWRSQTNIEADGGRALSAVDAVIGDVALALAELPDLMGRSGINPTLYLAASTASPTWKRLPVEIGGDALSFGTTTAKRKSVMGSASTALADGPTDGIDTTNSVEVELIDSTQWLVSCDDDALAAGVNLALIGDELIQFGNAEAVGTGRFRLTRLSRGRYSTEVATSTHATGDLFLLINPATLQPIGLPASARGAVVTVTCRTSESVSTASRLVDGRSLPTGVFIEGEKVVGSRVAGIPSPVGGATVDAEVRDAVSQILGALRTHGLIDT